VKGLNTLKKLFFDGGMGTCLQERGLNGDPMRLNLTRGEEITAIHRQYIEAGANIITANTFGAYTHKHPDAEELIAAALKHARAGKDSMGDFPRPLIALDMGPLGQMLEPYGDMTAEEAFALFSQAANAGVKYGADMILIETFFCINELEAAVRAAKATGLPVYATMTFDQKGRTTMGTPMVKMVELLEELNAEALGMNCGFGPDVYKALLPELLAATRLPVLVQPNAGLPKIVNNQTVYNVVSADFAQVMAEMNAMGCAHLGGCCGTTPAHIAAMVAACGGQRG
jgi:5-methyltetrahydrofolate--homocysteine methyltransferase